MKIEVNVEKKHVYILASILVLGFLTVYVQAFNNGVPAIMGHSWNDIANIPAGFADGVDDQSAGGGITVESDPTVLSSVKNGVSWNEITGTCSCGACWVVKIEVIEGTCVDDETHITKMCTPAGWKILSETFISGGGCGG